ICRFTQSLKNTIEHKGNRIYGLHEKYDPENRCKRSQHQGVLIKYETYGIIKYTANQHKNNSYTNSIFTNIHTQIPQPPVISRPQQSSRNSVARIRIPVDKKRKEQPYVHKHTLGRDVVPSVIR